MYFYAAVAAANFASTYCQYDALRFVGFTTQALAKCAKMVPVLLIGRLFYKKSYKEKEYVSWNVVRLSTEPTENLSTFVIAGRRSGRALWVFRISYIGQCTCEIFQVPPRGFIFRQSLSPFNRRFASMSLSWFRWFDLDYSRTLLWQIQKGHITSDA